MTDYDSLHAQLLKIRELCYSKDEIILELCHYLESFAFGYEEDNPGHRETNQLILKARALVRDE